MDIIPQTKRVGKTLSFILVKNPWVYITIPRIFENLVVFCEKFRCDLAENSIKSYILFRADS